MEDERIRELYSDFKNAFTRLKEALNEDLSKGAIVIDGSIQRFEFTFELAWKLLRNILSYNGIQADTPRAVIKEAFKAKFLKEGEGWIDMLEDRNKTSHIYDEKSAVAIYDKIKKNHLFLLEELARNAEDFINKKL